jgi:hypothetical protein
MFEYRTGAIDPTYSSLRRPFPDISSTSDFEDAEMRREIPDAHWSIAPGLPVDGVFVIRADALQAAITAGLERRHDPVRSVVSRVAAGAIQREDARSLDARVLPLLQNWRDLTIRFVSDKRLQFHIAGRPAEALNYAELGFEDRRSGKPTHVWQTFVRIAELDGILRLEDLPRRRLMRPQVEKHIQKIRAKLREQFPNVGGDPIPWRREGYCAEFRVSKAESFDA